MTEPFSIPYDIWYAATLLIEAGHWPADVLRRVGCDEADWRSRTVHYVYLLDSPPWLLQRLFEQTNLPDLRDPAALYARLTAGSVIERPPVAEPFDMSRQLRLLRSLVEANPQIGPFADLAWHTTIVGKSPHSNVRYLQNGRHVLANGVPLHRRDGSTIEGIDPLTFRMLADRWFCDEARIYCQGGELHRRSWHVVRGVDLDSFEVLNHYYARDTAAGYYCTGRRLPIIGPEPFEIVGRYFKHSPQLEFRIGKSQYARDGQTVYAYGSPIEDAHAPSFQSIGDEGVYFADRNRVYYKRRPIENADRDSFTCVPDRGQYNAYDRNQPYHEGLPRSVASSFAGWADYFQARPGLTGTWWHKEQARQAGDATEPIPIGGPYYSDGKRILVRNGRRKQDPPFTSLDHVDHQSFRHIVDGFAMDRSGLRYYRSDYWYGPDAVKGADPTTFRALGGGWYRDSGQAYYYDAHQDYCELVVVKADMPTFEALGGAYARDRKSLICAGIRKRGIVDFAHVVSLGFQYARLGDQLLYRGKIVPKIGKLDIASARACHPNLLIDAQGHMMFEARYRKPIGGVDVDSLRFLNRRFAVDRDRVYALSNHTLIVCPLADRASVEPDRFDTIRDHDGRIFYDGEFKREEKDHI